MNFDAVFNPPTLSDDFFQVVFADKVFAKAKDYLPSTSCQSDSEFFQNFDHFQDYIDFF